jgi:hypothetical protein
MDKDFQENLIMVFHMVKVPFISNYIYYLKAKWRHINYQIKKLINTDFNINKYTNLFQNSIIFIINGVSIILYRQSQIISYDLNYVGSRMFM